MIPTSTAGTLNPSINDRAGSNPDNPECLGERGRGPSPASYSGSLLCSMMAGSLSAWRWAKRSSTSLDALVKEDHAGIRVGGEFPPQQLNHSIVTRRHVIEEFSTFGCVRYKAHRDRPQFTLVTRSDAPGPCEEVAI